MRLEWESLGGLGGKEQNPKLRLSKTSLILAEGPRPAPGARQHSGPVCRPPAALPESRDARRCVGAGAPAGGAGCSVVAAVRRPAAGHWLPPGDLQEPARRTVLGFTALCDTLLQP